MLAQILASSAWTGVVWTIGGLEHGEQLSHDLARAGADAADDAGQGVDLLEEAPGGYALGRVGHEDLLANLKTAVLGQVARHEFGCAGGHRRAQGERVARSQGAEQVVKRRADVAHVDLDVREGRSAKRDHDVLGLGGVGDLFGERKAPAQPDALEQGLGVGLLEGHQAFAHRAETGGVVVDADRPQAPIGEGQGERQSDAAEADDGDVRAGVWL